MALWRTLETFEHLVLGSAALGVSTVPWLLVDLEIRKLYPASSSVAARPHPHSASTLMQLAREKLRYTGPIALKIVCRHVQNKKHFKHGKVINQETC